MLTADRLRQILLFDQKTGLFTWLVAQRGPAGKRHEVGDQAGWVSLGHVCIRVDGRVYQGGRLAWLYMTGEWPSKMIDHIDLDGTNNCWTNLREANKSQNGANRGAPSHNKSGLKGVSWSGAAGKWLARVSVDRKPIHLGVFDCKAAAHLAYVVGADKHFGEFARSA